MAIIEQQLFLHLLFAQFNTVFRVRCLHELSSHMYGLLLGRDFNLSEWIELPLVDLHDGQLTLCTCGLLKIWLSLL